MIAQNSAQRKIDPIQTIKRLAFDIRIKGVEMKERETNRGTEIILSLNTELYKHFSHLKVVLLKKKNGKISLDEKETTVDPVLTRKIRKYIADTNNREGGEQCGAPC